MKQRRLAVLLAVMAALVALRVWLPPKGGGSEGDGVVAAVVRPGRAPAPTREATALRRPPAEERDVPGDAFAVRVVRPSPSPPPQSSPPPLAKGVAKVVAFRGPPPPDPPPPPPPPPPLRVIGTWDDGASPGVFIDTGRGATVLARPGTVLLAEYRVTAVTAQEVSISHVSSAHAWRLPVPRASAPP